MTIRQQSRGQALVELALVLPLLLLGLFAIIDLGRVIWANDSVANAAREGARFAAVHGNAPITSQATKQDIRDHTLASLTAGGVSPVVTVCYSSVKVAQGTTGCSGDADEPGVATTRGAMVRVAVSSQVPILTGSLLGMGTFTVTGSSTMLVNN